MMRRRILPAIALVIAGVLLSASSAIADFTSPAGTTYTSGSSYHDKSGHITIKGAFVTVTCKKVTTSGSTSLYGLGKGIINNLKTTYEECNYPVKVKKGGSLEIDATGGGNGTVTSTGAEIEIETSTGVCIFTTNNTDLGTFTGGTPAAIDLSSAAIPRTGGSFLCGSSGTMNGSLEVTTPSSLYVD